MNTKEHWENIYKNKPADKVSWYQLKPEVSLELIENYSHTDMDYIIDVGGGASRLSAFLLDDGYQHLTVVDLSSNALAHAQTQLGDRSDLIEWKVEDVTRFVASHKFDIWHDRAVFHFLTDRPGREKYMQVLNSSINPRGYIIIAAFSTDGPTKCSGLDIVQYDTEKIKQELGENFRFIEKRNETHVTPEGKQQKFCYYVFSPIA